MTIATGTGQAADNLNDLASTINGDSLGVTASVVSDATGSRLAIISKTSGSAANFSITSANYTGTAWTSPDIPPGDTLGTNSFTLTSGGVTTTVSTTSGDSYATLAANINAMNLGVTATAGSDANGTSLSITSTDGTTPFTISEPSFGFTQSVTGANASLTVDGVPDHQCKQHCHRSYWWSELVIIGAAPGVPVNLAVTSNASQISTAINQFVSDYNTAIGLVNRSSLSPAVRHGRTYSPPIPPSSICRARLRERSTSSDTGNRNHHYSFHPAVIWASRSGRVVFSASIRPR